MSVIEAINAIFEALPTGTCTCSYYNYFLSTCPGLPQQTRVFCANCSQSCFKQLPLFEWFRLRGIYVPLGLDAEADAATRDWLQVNKY
jgi:hypothetical protein